MQVDSCPPPEVALLTNRPKVFSVESTGLPELAEVVDKGLPLGRVVSVSSGNPEEKAVVGLQNVRGDDRDILALRRSVHLAQNRLGQGLLDPAWGEVSGNAS